MKVSKAYPVLGLLAFVVLGTAAVWMGGLNQDEGWYLYAANLVSEGKVLYRDFFYTQGPMMPIVYSAFTEVWRTFGLLGARIFTLVIGAVGIIFAVALARRLVPGECRSKAAMAVFLLLGCNLYHLYYLTIPKTYALASLFVLMGFYLLSFALDRCPPVAILSALSLAFAAGARISLGALLCVTGLYLLWTRRWKTLGWFCLGGFGGLALVYGPFLLDEGSRAGLLAAQRYHAARGGFDLVWTVGSLSRLVRWYLPVFIVLGLGWGMKTGGEVERKGGGGGEVGQRNRLLLFSFLAVFAVQMLAPFPYEDYQVPIMGLLAVYAVVTFVENINTPLSTSTSSLHLLLVLGLSFANSFGSPLLEKWSVNGQDRFWSLKKPQTEMAQLREVAREIELLDPEGKMLLTQDLYLAVETNRKVPDGLEMGPFAMLSDDEWKSLLEMERCPIAALSGYAFAIEPPECNERPLERQLAYWNIVKRNYDLEFKEDSFGQGATPLLVLKRK